MTVEIAGVKIQCASASELPNAIKAELARIDERLKKAAAEIQRLRHTYRGLKQALEGKKPRPKQAPAAKP